MNPLTRLWRSIFRLRLPSTDEDERQAYVRRSVFLHLHPPTIAREALKLKHSFCLGGLSFLLFIVSVLTGVILMFYYSPTTAGAHSSITDIDNVVAFGQFIRALHRYASELMLITVFFHMIRVALHGAYKTPREFNWSVGVILLLLLLLTAFTGYLLPFDGLSYEAVSVAKGMADSASPVGIWINKLLFGGDKIGDAALLRTYVLHCIALPLTMFLLMTFHFWRVRRDGFKGGM
ncbi:MAG: cytochrome b N-terminal domain-containing protein [Candidatus Brocadiia bacterium]